MKFLVKYCHAFIGGILSAFHLYSHNLATFLQDIINLLAIFIPISKCAKLIYTISGLESETCRGDPCGRPLAVALILGGGKPRPYSVGIISP